MPGAQIRYYHNNCYGITTLRLRYQGVTRAQLAQNYALQHRTRRSDQTHRMGKAQRTGCAFGVLNQCSKPTFRTGFTKKHTKESRQTPRQENLQNVHKVRNGLKPRKAVE